VESEVEAAAAALALAAAKRSRCTRKRAAAINREMEGETVEHSPVAARVQCGPGALLISTGFPEADR
jgi:hypothetical protein